ncbi:folylpolyglutamate synthase/dihydrofolate synthase family protein [Aureibaculum sp. 2210JD6-5]|uniref:bifunctional folylpolyglutamate synthase/dihydrofolate synthase n=1 Tax=Aureibaculum sp. 2210JD6-5 TaxID=3103957 RepID=UPI002AADDD14|nr:folylpolyglutamate synthase/dihydrofolate synthase family protein [Aureibaculum sp. 2210JD6-5]MDY7396071.1 folylpolyglutamate synthase/dihydrofolate synthase family protein [Aureibaculum sp. 2210JD6-5]
MFSQLPMYQRQGKTAFKKDLTNTLALVEKLDNPHQKFKSVHIAGTNGKGSTSHMLASVLQEAGYKVGLYTSPHLKDFRERIKVDGNCIPKKKVVDFIAENKTFLEQQKLSFFEMTVGMAFNYFAEQEVDIALIEVGLGGRLDSTNIITPVVSVITNIGFDHMQMLGNTLKEIAFEKAGIIKATIPVVISESQKEVQEVFLKKALSLNAPIFFAEDEIIENYQSDLLGIYQLKNSKAVVQTLHILRNNGFGISENNIKRGLLNVVKNTGLLGRWQVLSHNPLIICDTAHNREGLNYVSKQLNEQNFDKLHIVIGVVNDKDLSSILPLFPKNATYYFCKPNIPRGLDVLDLKSQANKYQLLGEAYTSVLTALSAAKKNAKSDDLIFVGGSTFVVAEVV